MKYLALDIGNKRTGVAYFDDKTGFPMPLDTIEADSAESLENSVVKLISERKVDHLYIGLPLLPDGTVGHQANTVQLFVERLNKLEIPYSLVDERHTTPKIKETDPNAAAACEILHTILSRNS